jgi:type I restriction enzyme S subunit
MTKSLKTDRAPPQSSSLPDGWHTVRFGDVAKKISDIVDRKNCNLDHFVAGEHMQTDDFRIKEWGTIDDGYLGPAFNHKFSKGQILYGSRRTYLRKVSLPHFDGVCANTTFVIEPTGEDLVHELLPFVMQSAGFNEQSIRMSKGSTNPYINWKDIACYEFAVPEKEQQRHIATTLWAAEDCIVKGERFLGLAERTKQVLMRELFSKGIGHTEFKDVSGLGKIPKGWEIQSINGIVPEDKPITYGIVQAGPDDPDGIVYVRSGDLSGDHIDFNKLLRCSAKIASEYRRSQIRKGDILFSLRGNIGITKIAPPELDKANISRGIARISCRTDIDNFFINFFLNHPSLKKQVAAFAQGSTFGEIALGELKKLRVPIPTLPEQRQIAAILTRCDETIAAARADVVAAKALKMKMINEMLTPQKN